MKKLILFTALLFAAITITAQVIHVPQSKETIQSGIDAAQDYDTVLVAEGTYLENINFNGKKKITVASHFILDGDTSHISNTIIDGSQPENPDVGSVVTFESGEDTTSILTGFTITGGTGTRILEGPIDARGGGGVFFDRSGGKLTDNYIIENEVNYNNITMGGGIVAGGFIDPQPWLVLLRNRISHNKSISDFEQANSGGIEVYTNLIMIDNELSYNEAQSPVISVGGGASIRGRFGHIEVYIHNNLFSSNRSISSTELTEYSEGGGLVIFNDVEGVISNNLISENSVESHLNAYCLGAGVFMGLTSPDLLFENNSIRDNSSNSISCLGGGICIWHGGGIYQNNVIRNNKGTFGGGVYLGRNNSDSLSVLINNTIINNESEYGGGIYLSEADAIVFNTILWNNEALSEGSEIFNMESILEVRHSNIGGEEEWPGQGNMNVDPEFRPDGYHLDFPSLLVNEGKSSIQINGEYYDAPEYDIDGDERPFDGTYPDIGADEAQWYYTVVDESANTQYSVLDIYPNPFSNVTKIEFELQASLKTNITIYNHLGEVVDVVLNEEMVNGKHIVEWNAENQPAGVYYCVLRTKNKTQTVKIIRF